MSKEKSVLLELLTKVDDLKKEIDTFHPLPIDVEERIMQKFRLDWNYNSNAIEGNALNYGETVAFLMHGITAHGKPLKDYLDIKGHNQAINYLINFVRNREELTETVIRELHKAILVEPYEIDAVTADGKPTKRTVAIGAYKTQPNHVKTATGEMHYFATPEETPAKMEELMNWYRKTREDKEVHPVVLAAFFHHRFVSIHPFDDGNGRMARLLMNLLLMQSNYPPVVIKTKDKNNYYLALSQADAGDTSPFVEYVANTLIHSEEIYLKGARGESIDEPNDIDKEIDIIKRELLTGPDKIEKRKDGKTLTEFKETISIPLLDKINIEIEKFSSLFLHFERFLYDETKFNSPNSFNKSLDNSIKQILKHSGKILDSSLIYGYKFNDFKNAKKAFSFSLTIMIKLNDYDYEIKYSFDKIDALNYDDLEAVLDLSNTLVKNYYHQKLTDETVKHIITVIKTEMLTLIKSKTELS